ncbi:MAG TPA: PIN domain-containing protein [Thermoleophilaceae bacterium]
MKEVVLDASVVIKWFRSDGERHVEQARALRRAYEQGELLVFEPRLLGLEIINIAGRRWHLTEQALTELAGALSDLGFEHVDPDLSAIARWTAKGLSAYDAAYVAVAESASARLVTDDEHLASVADTVAEPLREILR